MSGSPPQPTQRAFAATGVSAEHAFLALMLGVLIVRIGALLTTPLGLHPDEAQYWVWSRSIEWGYFSKPPLIAWLIAATTAVFGNAEWAARLASPFLHTAVAWLLFLLGRGLYSPAVGAFAGIAWLFIPSVWLSSMLVSTDAALLPLWTLALLAFHRLMEKPSWSAAALLGVAIGFGALAKYAMLYFPLCAALAALWLPQARRAVLSWKALAACAIALLILTPNLIWNAQNDFATVGHTLANANIAGNDDLVNVDEAGSFVVDQLGMAGLLTLTFAVMLVSVARRKTALQAQDRFLLAFILPPLLIILAQSFISRAHANWAASAYPALVLLTVAFLAAPGRRGWLTGIVVTHALAYAVFSALIVAPALADSVGLSNALKRLRGWDATAAVIEKKLADKPYGTILVDHRHLYFELRYLWRDNPAIKDKLRMWVLREAANNHAERLAPMTPDAPDPVLTVQMSPHYTQFLAADFKNFKLLGVTDIPTGGNRVRPITFGEAETFQRQQRTPELLEKIGR